MEIATRLLKLRHATGEIEIPVRIFEPEKNDADWSCRFEIDWPDEQEAGIIYGYDSVQVLLLVFPMVGSRIYASEEHKSGSLFLAEPGRGYGFPVPYSERHLLIGDDKELS